MTNLKKVLYTRVSTTEQNNDRQKIDVRTYDMVIEDSIDGDMPLFDRPGGSKIRKLIADGVKFHLFVHELDRLGRNALSMLNTIEFLNKNLIPLTIVNFGITTLSATGEELPMPKFMIAIFSYMAEMEKKNIKKRQKEGIAEAKLKGKFTGRKVGTTEDAAKFLAKYDKELGYLRKEYSFRDISAITGVSPTTLTKVKRLAGI
jgi:DNA invertase Pin-like site-specific DNA recombinase